MEIQSLKFQLWTFWWAVFIFSFVTSYPSFEPIFETSDNPSITFTYNRFAEIENHCGFIMSSASELGPDDNRGERMKKELFFMNGDWDQESGGAPLMPFDSRAMPIDYYGYGSPLKLVSFWVVDVDSVRPAKNTVSITAVMEIGITRSSPFSYKPYELTPAFHTEQGLSRLKILFEGIYVESKENGGQHLMCLLGNTTMPTASGHVDSWDYEDQHSFNNINEPPLKQDDQIMLVLHFPEAFTLTTRGISGEMQSLNEKLSLTYFDRVHISSQLGRSSRYQFGSKELLSKACTPYPYRDNLIDEESEMFKGEEYCEKLRDFVWSEIFNFVPNWKYIGTSDDRIKQLGPFFLSREIEATDGYLDNFRLMVQDLQCEPGNGENGIKTANVSAVFRVIDSSEYKHREEERTGLSSTTLSAEGIWRSSDGQLCMIGCLGLVGPPSDRCNSRICLYFPLIFSIKQKTTIFGTISSINEPESYTNLIFEKETRPKNILDRYQFNTHLKWSYNYSKIIQARDFWERRKPSKFGTILRKSFLRYPSLKSNDMAGLSFLSDVLSVETCAVPQTFQNPPLPKTYVEIMLLSTGSLFGRYWPRSPQVNLEVENPFHPNAETIEISGLLSIKGDQFYNRSLFFEGLYDQGVGKMYLIGCRDVRAFRSIILNRTNLEGGMDCLNEIIIQYPPRNARWLLNPSIKFSIKSKRNKEDPLHIKPISLNTFLLVYTKKVDDVIFRKSFEAMARIVMITVAILCTISQSIYAENEGHSTAYMSLVMLGVHALGYSIPLITGGEVMFKWKEVAPDTSQIYDIKKFQRFQVLNCSTKILLLVALLLTTKLIQKIWESRSRQLGHAKKLKPRMESDKLVFIITLVIHLFGFLIFHYICKVYPLVQSKNYTYRSGNFQKLLKWWGELENYAGLVQDFFLLPQIVANALWRIQGKPLRKFYYFGFTMIRVFIHAYDYARDPVPNPNRNEDEFQYLGLDFYSKLGNIAIAVIVIGFAVTVYFQQRCNYQKSRQTKKLETCEDLIPKSDL